MVGRVKRALEPRVLLGLYKGLSLAIVEGQEASEYYLAYEFLLFLVLVPTLTYNFVDF